METVFAYIRLVKEAGLTKDRFKEYSFISYLEFLYADRDNIEDFMLDLIGKLHEAPINHILLRDKVTMDYDPQVIG